MQKFVILAQNISLIKPRNYSKATYKRMLCSLSLFGQGLHKETVCNSLKHMEECV